MATSMEGSSIGKDCTKDRSVKILVLGDYNIGKTTLIQTYLKVDELPTDPFDVFDKHRAQVKHNGEPVDVALYDVKSGPLAPERREFYPTGVNAILLCFSIGHYESLKCVYNLWIHEVRAHYGRSLPIFLVGLRSDLRLFDDPIEMQSVLKPMVDRVVEKSEAEKIHKEYNFYGEYMECSHHDRPSVVNAISEALFAALSNSTRTDQ